LSCTPQQVVLHDRQTAETIRVSVAPDGRFGNAGVERAALSSDGRHVVFKSRASNLVAGDTNLIADIFVARIGDGNGPRGSFADPFTDTDRDGRADECDGDDDGDTIADTFESLYGLNPLDAADRDLDADQDGLTNLAESRASSNPTNADTDADGVLDGVDNCILDANTSQANFDGDTRGDACDADDDNDGTPDSDDPTPRGPSSGSSTAPTSPQPTGTQPAAPASQAANPSDGGGGGALGGLSLMLLLALTAARKRGAAPKR
jgi:hypothetical protein